MSAGTGVFIEKNSNPEKPVKFLQIWVFPKAQDIAPRYDQKTFARKPRKQIARSGDKPD